MNAALSPRLIAIVDGERAAFGEWLARLAPLLALAEPASVLVMLRDRQLPVRERRAVGDALRRLTLEHAQLLSVNDRLDLAVLLSADAVHLPESGVGVDDARAFGARHGLGWWVSRSSHEPAEAAATGADAVVLAPVAAERKGRPALGVAGLERARAQIRSGRPACRLYALGGVTAAKAPALLAAGADGVALIGALLEPGAPAALAAALGIERRSPAAPPC